jgi:uncharacterized membrane protein
LGSGVLIYNEISPNSDVMLSIIGLTLLVTGLYLISRGIGDRPDYDPYAVQSEEEEE